MVEITPEMIEAGEDVILCEVGGADLGGFFSATDLAFRVFKAMDEKRQSAEDQTSFAETRMGEWAKSVRIETIKALWPDCPSRSSA